MMPPVLVAVRGAIDVEQNTADAITDRIVTLLQTVVRENQIEPEQVVSLFFTVTPDLTALNPAAALRSDTSFDWRHVPMLCSQEPALDTELLPRCVRLLIQWYAPEALADKTKPVYLGEAQKLRPDLH